jgi:phosphate starvation-inducible PhoH-like protein
LKTQKTKLRLKPENNARLAALCGPYNEHIETIEKALGVTLSHRGHYFEITGTLTEAKVACSVLKQLYQATEAHDDLPPAQVHLVLQTQQDTIMPESQAESAKQEIIFHAKVGAIKAYTRKQQQYTDNIRRHDVNFCIGPAGTGKTYLAVALAVAALESEQVKRLLLVRPAVEAGERLGHLPGALEEKIDPYLRPLYDALFDMLGSSKVARYLEQGIIEIAPLAYMRGRTLNESFIILDESQNTTTEQMKMFLTRIGFGAKAVITGDVTQMDLPKGKLSGLIEAQRVLQNIAGISFTYFDPEDVVRHSLVQRIIEAYNDYEAQQSS